MQVIYADILFIINIYITYLLLLLTSLITKTPAERLRLVASSFFSGAYSLVILVPNITDTAISLSRIPAMAVILLISFKVINKRHFLKLAAAFLAVNFAFFGVMFCLWYFFSPRGMYFNSGIVYFDIDAFTLLILTALCYFILKTADSIISLKAPKNTIYDLEITVGKKKYVCRSFLDTGNNLKDYFTSYPVIVVNRDVLKEILPEDFSDEKSLIKSQLKFRFILCSGIGEKKLLPAFLPEKVKISSLKSSFETERVIVAVTEKTIKNGEYGAILPWLLFQNKQYEKGESHAEKITQSH